MCHENRSEYLGSMTIGNSVVSGPNLSVLPCRCSRDKSWLMRVANAWSRELVVGGGARVEEGEGEEDEDEEAEERTKRAATAKLTRWYVLAFLSLVPATQTCANLREKRGR